MSACATSASGYSAMGATSCSSSSALKAVLPGSWVAASGGQLTSTTSSRAADFQKVGRIVMSSLGGVSMTVVILGPEGRPVNPTMVEPEYHLGRTPRELGPARGRILHVHGAPFAAHQTRLCATRAAPRRAVRDSRTRWTGIASMSWLKRPFARKAAMKVPSSILANVRIAASVLFCSSASTRYGIIAHRGQDDLAGHGKITGRQKSNPMVKKQACWT